MAAPRRRRRPKRYHHGNLKPLFLKVALEVLESEGLEKLSLRRVSMLVGVSHSAPYNHFPNRQSLLVALAVEGFGRLFTRMRSATDSVGPGDFFSALGQEYFSFAKENPNLFGLMFSRLVFPFSVYSELRQVSSEAFETLVEAAGAFADPGQKAGLSLGERTTVALAAWALSHGATLLIMNQGIEWEGDTAESPQDLMDRLGHSFSAALNLQLSLAERDAESGEAGSTERPSGSP